MTEIQPKHNDQLRIFLVKLLYNVCMSFMVYSRARARVCVRVRYAGRLPSKRELFKYCLYFMVGFVYVIQSDGPQKRHKVDALPEGTPDR